MAGGVPVVTAPTEIDATTVGQLRVILLKWHAHGHVTVVVDMTGTQFCDSAGLRELVRAHKDSRSGAARRLEAARLEFDAQAQRVRGGQVATAGDR
jgi:anti-anti-sigma factor